MIANQQLNYNYVRYEKKDQRGWDNQTNQATNEPSRNLSCK